MSKQETVFNYYKACNVLKDTIRTGWLDWKVNKERLESVAEHIYGTQMLAIAMQSEFKYDIDLMKVINMLAIHELGECVIGDFVFYEIDAKEKEKLEHNAVHDMLSGLMDKDYIEELFLEFDAHETLESKFAYQCDKLECDLQCKLYDMAGGVDLTKQRSEHAMENEKVKELIEQGKTWSDMWISFDIDRGIYDDNFKSVAEYAINCDKE